MSGSGKKRCPYCKCLYWPDPRIKGRQKACKKDNCQKERKREGQRKWLEKNPGHFRGQYGRTKEWLSSHPGYMKGYRESHPEYVERNRQAQRTRDKRRSYRCQNVLDIQDKIRPQDVENIDVNKKLPLLDIQDETLSKSNDIINILAKLPCLDIQV